MKIKLFFNAFFRFILISQVFFLSTGALYGGFMLLKDPSGHALQMPPDTLLHIPFPDLLIPGLILFIILGLIPLFLVYPLIAKPPWKWANCLNIYKSQHWSWTYSLFLGIILVTWMDVQIQLLGYGAFIQTFFALFGVTMIIVTLIPSNMHYYSTKN